MVKGIGHVAILVGNLDETIKLYQKLFGATASEVKVIPEQGVKTAMLDIGGDAKLEILEPLPGGNMEKILEKRGRGCITYALRLIMLNKHLISFPGMGLA